MSITQRQRKPVTPTILLVSGIVVGLVGLVMLILGMGRTAPTSFKIPGVNFDISTTSIALVVTFLGFGVAVAVLASVAAYARGAGSRKTQGYVGTGREQTRPIWGRIESLGEYCFAG
jgi:membrane-bound ClpP family serine protease